MLTISILVPVYGVEKYIEKCAKSLFEQSYENIEYIFVNDCTKDKSITVLKKLLLFYPNRVNSVRIIDHDTNKGLAAARNTAVLAATGDYVVPVDSDDFLEINTITEIVNIIESRGADVVQCGMNHVFKKRNYCEHVNIPKNHEEYINKLITRDCKVCMCGGAYKKELFIDNNVFAIPGLNMGEDYSTKPRLMYYAKNPICIDKPLYNYVHYNENSYTTVFSINQMHNLQWAIDVLKSFFSEKSDYNSYELSLKTACLKSKVILLKTWGLSNDKKHFCDIRKWNADLPISLINNKVDRMLLLVSNWNCPTLARLIVKCGYNVKQFINNLR